MKLLITTQAIDENDSALGFFIRWVEEFAKRAEAVEIICLRKGVYHLPANVRIHSLGKEHGQVSRFMYAWRFLRLIWRLRHNYDAVFVHMNPDYVVLGGWWWKLAGKRVVLWYSHRNVDLKLRIAALWANVIASSATSSFRLKTDKLYLLGHGIDTNLFSPGLSVSSAHWRLVSVGRITPIKHLETAIEALALLRQRGVEAELKLVGQAGSPSDHLYERHLKERIGSLALEPYVHFEGPVQYGRMARVYHEADVSLNMAPTGGLDKAVLESMACGLPTLVSNEGFDAFLGPHRQRLLFRQDDAADLADKLQALHDAVDIPMMGMYLREQVLARASLNRIIESLQNLLWPE